MSNTSRGEDFAELRRLLALKRHELPPPGYFDTFHHQVVERIEAMEARGPWWTRWMDAVVLKPAFAAGFAAVALGFYAFGLGPQSMSNPAGIASPQVLSGSVNAIHEPTAPERSRGGLILVHPPVAQPVISPFPTAGSPFLNALALPTNTASPAAFDPSTPVSFSVVD